MAEKPINTTVSVRLPLPVYEEVLRLAEKRGKTKGQIALELVLASLESYGHERNDDPMDIGEVDIEGVEEAFESLRVSVADLRVALGRGVAAIPQDVTPNRSKEEIKKWVFDRIITPSKTTSPEGDDSP
jgi:hypothetical protein